ETLADITVLDPAGNRAPLTGGFQLLELLSVGVMLTVSPAGTLAAPAEPLHPQRPTIDDPNADERDALVEALAEARRTGPAPPPPAPAASRGGPGRPRRRRTA